MRKLYLCVLLGMVLFVSIFSVSVSASFSYSDYDKSIEERSDNWFGYKSGCWIGTSITFNTRGSYIGVLFRSPYNTTIDVVAVYVNWGAASWAGKKITLGFQSVNLATGVPSGTWLGATGDARVDFTPATGTYLKEYTLNESVTLVANTMYFFGLFDNYNAIGAGYTPIFIAYNNVVEYYWDFANAMSPFGLLEMKQRFIVKTNIITGANTKYTSLTGWYLKNGASNSTFGAPYYSFGDTWMVNDTYANRINFTAYENYTCDGLGAPLRTANGYSAVGDVFAVIYRLSDDVQISPIVRIASPIDSGSTATVFHYMDGFCTSFDLVKDTEYYIKIYGNSKDYWLIPLARPVVNSTCVSISFGAYDNWGYSRDNGTTWTYVTLTTGRDMFFRIHKVVGVTRFVPLDMNGDRLSIGIAVGLMFGGLGLFIVGGRRRRKTDARYSGRI